MEIVQVMQVSVLTGVLLCYRRHYRQRYCGDCTGSGVSVLTGLFVCWLVGCLTSQQQASVSQGRIC